MTGDELIIGRDELVPVLLHRNLLVFLAGCVGVLLALDIRGEAVEMPSWQLALFFGLCQCVVIACVTAFLLWRSRRSAEEMVTIHLSGPTVVAALALVLFSEARIWLLGGTVLTSPFDLVSLWFLFYVIGEVEVVLLVTQFGPPILHDLRQGRMHADKPAAGVIIGPVELSPAEIRHARAEGNYVDIRTDGGRHYVLGTLSAVMAQIPDGLGRQIHRSHWVAERVLDGFWRDGRDIVVRLDDGTEVRVAQSRQRDILPWLEASTADLRDRRPRQGQTESFATPGGEGPKLTGP